MPAHSGISGLDDYRLRARLVAAVQLRVNRAGKRLRVVRNHAHAGKLSRGGNFGVRNHVASNE